MNINFYEILGVSENSTEEEIKKAYKEQMKKWHPDLNKSEDAIAMSAKINEAKEILLDPIKRKDYDDYLKQKTDENYNRYTQRKKSTEENNNNNYQEEKTVTKWEYLSDWLKYTTVPKPRKVLAVIGVLLESFLCFIIKCLLIIISFFCYILSDFIQILYSQIYPLLGIIGLVFGIKCFTDGFSNIVKENPSMLILVISIILVYISSYLLPLIANLLLSKKTFNLLYNKLDVNLFKKCVGIK